MNQRGIDYASVDANATPDFVKARAAGAEFAIIRKSFVLHDVKHRAWRLAADPHYARDVAKARSAGLVVGSYGFFTFAKHAPNAREQVANLLHAAGGVMRGRDLPYCIDVEFPGKGIVETGRTQLEAFDFLRELITEVRKQAGVSPLIYTSHVQWHDDNGLGGPDHSVLLDCPLWIKTPYRLKARQPVDPTPPRLPHVDAAVDDPHEYWRVPTPWQRQGWWVHQYQGDAIEMPGFNRTVDLNHFSVLTQVQVGEVGRIRWLQRRLGATLKADGKWGPLTDNALRAFQTAHNLPVTGTVDVTTFASLCW